MLTTTKHIVTGINSEGDVYRIRPSQGGSERTVHRRAGSENLRKGDGHPSCMGGPPGPDTVQSEYPWKTLKPSSPAAVRFEVHQVEQFPVTVLCKTSFYVYCVFLDIGFGLKRVAHLAGTSRQEQLGEVYGNPESRKRTWRLNCEF